MKTANFSFISLIFSAILLDLLTGMEFDLFLPSFPVLQHTFSLSVSQVEALLSLNFLGYCLGIPFVGSLSDRYGRKPLILGGLTLFILGSLCCLLAHNYFFLLGGRFLQGLGISSPAILSFLIIADRVPLKQQQVLMGLLNASMNMAAAFAPVLGSFLTLYFNWQSNFIALLGIGVMSFILILLFLQEDPVTAPAIKEPYWKNYRKFFECKTVKLLLFFTVTMIVPYWIFVGIAPVLYMNELGVSLAHFGYYQGVQALAFGIGSLLFGLITHSVSHRKFLKFSNWLFIVSLGLLLILAIFKIQNAPLLTLGLLLFVLGQIVPSSLIYTLTLNVIPELKGTISAIIQVAKLILSAFSVQLAAYTYDHTFTSTGMIMSAFILAAIVSLHVILKTPRLIEDES